MIRFTMTIERLKKALPRPAAFAAWMGIAVFAFMTSVALLGRDRIATQQQLPPQQAAIAFSDPAELSAADLGLYSMIREKQARNDFAGADPLIQQLTNTRLVGFVLAERYLDANYKVTTDELKFWLAHYYDHPQTARIASIAVRRGLDVNLPKTVQPLKGDGYSDHLGRSTMPDSWFTALTFWREGSYDKAKTIFEKVSEDDSLSDWQRAAAYYWTYRANDKLGARSAAQTALSNAAAYPTTFYGLLASAQQGRTNITAEAPEVSNSLRNDPRAIRAALLVQIGEEDAAEDELRALYSASDKATRRGIVTLASELNMPNLQIRLARTQGLSSSEAIFAQFPVPQYMVDLHPVMDSALLLAVARNESGFRDVAHNKSSGALGMMQMLPTTARAVEKRVGQDLLSTADAGSNTGVAERLSDPAMSARYGAEYLKMLSQEKAINGNLVHLLVGYNAGPGTVAAWKAAGRNVTDPLLYIESIPYSETRNYVMQVSAQYWVYQMMMDETPTSLRALARGQWPQMPASRV